ncbi:NAD(P)-dependent alcohol dehydrogenase [Streptomyces sp. NPDC101132]|uniref:NAD(P)-dependent alcohol dehydrogenase n=1 Tax=Streptomyces sp. NPDC101132 TaxID=3366110 RepID=UPI00381175B6
MKAIVQDRYGSADGLRLAEVPVPVPGPREVLVRVRAAGAHIGDWHMMTGLPAVARLGLGLTRPRQRVRGTELAGTVEAVGSGVTAFRPGDEVLGTGRGTFAEYALAREDRLAAKPAGLGFIEAAALPVSGGTALQALRAGGPPAAGARVLVIGAGGAVGSYAVQLARAGGGRVTGVCSGSKAPLVLSLGAERVVDYTREPFEAVGTGYDLVLDTAGNRPPAELRRVLGPAGTLVIVGAEGGGRLFGTLGRTLRASLPSPFARQRTKALVAVERGQDVRVLADLAAADTVHPVISRTFALRDAPEALRELGRGHGRGKLVVTVAGAEEGTEGTG